MQATLIVEAHNERIIALTLELRSEAAEHAKQLQSSTLTQQHLRQQVDSQNEQLRRLERLKYALTAFLIFTSTHDRNFFGAWRTTCATSA